MCPCTSFDHPLVADNRLNSLAEIQCWLILFNMMGDDADIAIHPNWADHVVLTLKPFLRQLPKICNPQLKLHIWSDCAGLCSEMCAADEIERALRDHCDADIKFVLHGACDSCPNSKKFIIQNHNPKHWASCIKERGADGHYMDTKGDAVADKLPSSGIDIYVAGWPCQPFSHRGKRKGGDDPRADIVWSVIDAIKLMSPAFFILENVVAVQDARDDFWDRVQQKFRTDVSNYNIVTMNNVSPLSHGYPAVRPRMKLIGARADVCSLDKVNLVINTLVANPLIPCNWMVLLGMRSPGLSWEQPVDIDVDALNGCKCGVSPWIVCPAHPCKCNICKADSSKNGCLWRKSAAKFMEKRRYGDMIQNSLDKPQLSYVQLADLQGVDTPKQPRVRHMLNVLAESLPEADPLADTVAIVDITQSLERQPWKLDGTVPPIATNTVLWSLMLGKCLTTKQTAELMGHRFADGRTDFATISKTAQKTLIGNSIHVAVIGSLMIAEIAMACPS